jgi:hypothetical protein
VSLLGIAIPLGVASAAVYGASTVVQHHTAQANAGPDGGESAAGLLRLIRSPVWLLAIAGDGVGFVLQVGALAAGSVVTIQPLVVLQLPVALAVSTMLRWYRAQAGDYLGAAAVVAGLAAFLALIGDPGGNGIPRTRDLGIAIIAVLAIGALLSVAVIGRHRVIRGVMYGAVSGAYFGSLAVMVDAASTEVTRAGWLALVTTPRGLVPLAGISLFGIGGQILTQISFQVGALGATLPAQLAVDPLTGVILGSILLDESIPITAGYCVAYAVCVLAVVGGAIRLAQPTTRTVAT